MIIIIHHATLSTSCMALEWGLNFMDSNVISWHPTLFRVQGLGLYRLIQQLYCVLLIKLVFSPKYSVSSPAIIWSAHKQRFLLDMFIWHRSVEYFWHRGKSKLLLKVKLCVCFKPPNPSSISLGLLLQIFKYLEIFAFVLDLQLTLVFILAITIHAIVARNRFMLDSQAH